MESLCENYLAEGFLHSEKNFPYGKNLALSILYKLMILCYTINDVYFSAVIAQRKDIFNNDF